MTYRKKLIEIALPLDVINKASVRESYIYRGNPSSLHKWWSQKPMATARAVIFAQMVDDPSEHPDIFTTLEEQEKERQRLFCIIEDLVKWENITNQEVLQQARDEIWKSWRYTCAENADHPQAEALFDPYKLPGFYDPFAGGGTLPLEAQRLGLESHASDLNPVAVLITKSMIEMPQAFLGKAPVNPEIHRQPELITREWHGAQGLAEDLRYYGSLMIEMAENRIGSLYPKVEVTSEIVQERPELNNYLGHKLTVIAWLWARTVLSPNPAFRHVTVPLTTTFMLSTKVGKEVYVEPIFSDGNYRFIVKIGMPRNIETTKLGTKSGGSGSNFLCLMSGAPIPFEYIRSEAIAGRMGLRLMAVVVESDNGRIYLPPTANMENIAFGAQPVNVPETELPEKALGFRIQKYGMTRWSDLFTSRQLVAISTFSELIQEIRERVKNDMLVDGIRIEGIDENHQISNIDSYANAIAVYLAFAVDKHAMYGNSLVPWYTQEDRPSMLFTQQVVSMVWNPAEVNPFTKIGGSISKSIDIVSFALEGLPEHSPEGRVLQMSATATFDAPPMIISTDPPYFDNMSYADLSDFFYVWLRRSLKNIIPEIFSTLVVPKAEELVATPFRHGTKQKAEEFFLTGMTQAMQRLHQLSHEAFPVTIYYAFKQGESNASDGITNTGWETFLDAVIRSGFVVTGTWPMRTERTGRMRENSSNALASSIVLVCRPRNLNAGRISRREFVNELLVELPKALTYLQEGNIAPVDLAQAAIGPGMAVFTRYAQVIDAQGQPLSVRQALGLINQVLDEVLAEQEGDFDSDTRWALAWFEQSGFAEGEYGVAETLSKAKDTSVDGMVDAGILLASRGKVRLLKPNELPKDWNPNTDKRLTTWEMVHQLIRTLESDGESKAAELMAQIGSKAETARELCYRLYTICERKKRAPEALSYNTLVQSWPEIIRLSREINQRRPTQTSFL